MKSITQHAWPVKFTQQIVLDYVISRTEFDWLYEHGRESVDWMLDPCYAAETSGLMTSDIEYDTLWFKDVSLAALFVLRFGK